MKRRRVPQGVGRFVAQAWLVARIYLGYKLIQLAHRLGDGKTAARLERHHRRSADAVRLLAIRLEALPIKVCQFLGARADVLPEAYVEVLSTLQDRVPPRPLTTLLPLLASDAYHRGSWKKRKARKFADLLAKQEAVGAR